MQYKTYFNSKTCLNLTYIIFWSFILLFTPTEQVSSGTASKSHLFSVWAFLSPLFSTQQQKNQLPVIETEYQLLVKQKMSFHLNIL